MYGNYNIVYIIFWFIIEFYSYYDIIILIINCYGLLLYDNIIVIIMNIIIFSIFYFFVRLLYLFGYILLQYFILYYSLWRICTCFVCWGWERVHRYKIYSFCNSKVIKDKLLAFFRMFYWFYFCYYYYIFFIIYYNFLNIYSKIRFLCLIVLERFFDEEAHFPVIYTYHSLL